jgi:LacI family transcriptional regulator
MKDLIESHPDALPTAVFAMNDLMAIGAMDAIREKNLRIPKDISVVGFDDREVSNYVFPKLTTVEIDLKTIGYTAAQMVTQKLSETGELANARSIIIPSKVALRDTVTPIL